MKKLYLLAILPLMACSSIDTPDERYYAANNAVVVVLRATDSYIKECKKQVATDPCYAKFPALNKSVKTLSSALAQADKVFVTKDNAYYDLAISAVQNAIDEIRNILSKESV